jgi:hypothetical protein
MGVCVDLGCWDGLVVLLPVFRGSSAGTQAGVGLVHTDNRVAVGSSADVFLLAACCSQRVTDMCA